MSTPATVVISTRNRKDELRTALRSVFNQTAHPEVLVMDDGSTDGTEEMVRSEFPGVSFHRSEQSIGYIAQRNRGVELAQGEIVFSIDDDAVFSSIRIIEQTLAEFTNPRIAVIAMPFINVNKDSFLWQRAPDDGEIHVAANYQGTAYAVRRHTFLKLGGYRPYLVHQGEEIDFCIRLLQAGYVVAHGRADPIHHFESPKRNLRRATIFGSRNDLFFAWQNVPSVDLPGRLTRATAGAIVRGIKTRHPIWTLQGLLWGLGTILVNRPPREPVSRSTYKMFREVLKSGSMPLRNIEPRLPPIDPVLRLE
jgi:glycosyltransferase involved in cell wall biosynthesis